MNEFEEFDNKLSLIIRHPQEGKTFICALSINRDKSRKIHIVITMNTISSSDQFFVRIINTIGEDKILIFNSKVDKKSNYQHVRHVFDIINKIKENNTIKVIICCAHTKRIRDDIIQLLKHCEDLKSLHNKINFEIHIDEAHKYIPENRDAIRQYNDSTIVKGITGYSATPDRIYSEDEKDLLYHRILIRDIEKEYEIIRSPKYFGVKDCEFIIIEKEYEDDKILQETKIPFEIPETIINQSEYSGPIKLFQTKTYKFNHGDEHMLLSYIKFILPKLNINNNKFSYNFVPGYLRKVTQYMIKDIILNIFNNANVIIMKGEDSKHNKIELWRNIRGTNKCVLNNNNINESHKKDKQLMEPSVMIEHLIKNYNDCPTFVTGFMCVEMSVTLINEKLGNFDNVIVEHSHFAKNDDDTPSKGRDTLYQLCRFLFNYASWSETAVKKIKKTKIYSLRDTVAKICKNYEKHVRKMSTEFAGIKSSLNEITGKTIPQNIISKENKLNSIMKYIKNNSSLLKKFKVYDGNDDEEWLKASKFYKDVCGKELKGKSKPKLGIELKKIKDYNNKNDNFYFCSTTKKIGIQLEDDIKKISSYSWYSTFQLVQNKLNYARVFVGYNNLEDDKEYTIYIKYVQLEKNDEVLNILKEYGKAIHDDSEEENIISDSSSDTEPYDDNINNNKITNIVVKNVLQSVKNEKQKTIKV
jgi:hypothetical protein